MNEVKCSKFICKWIRLVVRWLVEGSWDKLQVKAANQRLYGFQLTYTSHLDVDT